MSTNILGSREYPNPRPLGYVPSDFEDIKSTEDLRCKIQEFLEKHRYDVCRGYLEAYADSISPAELQVLLEVVPELLQDDTADLLLNSGNIECVEFMMEKGWTLKQIIADTISDCIQSNLNYSDYTQTTTSSYQPDYTQKTLAHYQPIVKWIQQKGLKITTY